MKISSFLNALLAAVLCWSSISLSSADEFETTDFILDDQAALIPVLEGVRRVRVSQLNDDGKWQVYSLVHLAGDEGRIKLRLPDGVPLSEVCVEVSKSDPFPFEVYQGQSEFVTTTSARQLFWYDDAPFVTTGNRAGDAVAVDEVAAVAPEVQESDLWQWHGEKLYFFNQLRGLQVFDFSDPTRPERLDSLRMPNVGEDMFLHPDGRHLVLLAKRWSWGGGRAGSEAVVVRHSEEGLTITSRIPLPGNHVVESRMVGSHLYVALQNARRVETVGEDLEPLVRWESGMTVEHIDLSDPANPVNSDTLDLFSDDERWFRAMVSATSDYFLIAPSSYNQTSRTLQSTLHLIDIRDQKEPLRIAATTRLDGHLKDKFKLRLRDGILTCVTQGGSRSAGLKTVVANYHLSEYRRDGEIPHLDSLILAPRETLFATRFDGDRLYVVTAIQIDPLFVIDLGDSDDLRLLGELKIPGWSHYLQPRGDRLLSVGVEGRRVAISQFDVSDPANMGPPLRVYLGEEGTSSWSEANYDEQAIGYFPEEGVMIVPFESDGPETHPQSALQILTFGDDFLEKAGVIESNFVPRRATLLDSETLVSVSGREVNVLDVSDLAEPQPVSSVETAWTVDRIISAGDHLLQIESGGHSYYGWHRNEPASKMTLRVTPSDALDTVVGQVELTGHTLAGAELEGDFLHLLTRETGYEWVDEEAVWKSSAWYQLVDLSDPSAPVTSEPMVFSEPVVGQNYQGRPLQNGLMAWIPRIEEDRWGGRPFAIDFWIPGQIVSPDSELSRRAAQILIVDASDPAAPTLVADHRIGLAAEGPAIGGDEGRDLTSRVTLSEVVEFEDEIFITFEERTPLASQDLGHSREEIRSYLRVVTLAADGLLTAGPAVSVPGKVSAVRPTGDDAEWLLLSSTVSDPPEDEEGFSWSRDLVLQTSVFDGWRAFLIDEETVPEAYLREMIVSDRHFVVPDFRSDGSYGLDFFPIASDGEITERHTLEIDFHPARLVHQNGLLMASGWEHNQEVWWMVNLHDFEAEEPAVVETVSPFFTDFEQAAFNEDRTFAWFPVGRYGVESLDLAALSEGPGLWSEDDEIMGRQVGEVWMKYPVNGRALTAISANDELGPLFPAEIWRYRRTAAVSYHQWMAREMNEEGNPEFVVASANGDYDGDGRSNWAEYVFGTDPSQADADPLQIRRAAAEGELEIAFDLPLGRRGVTWEVQFSRNLIAWETIPGDRVFAEIVDRQTTRVVCRPHLMTGDEPVFFQVVLKR